MSKTIELKEMLLDGMPGVQVEYLRLGGNGVQGRWYFQALWKGRVFHLEYQPNSYKYSRAGVLQHGLSKSTLGQKILSGLRPEVLNAVVEDIAEQVKEIGLYPKLRRSNEQLARDLTGFMSSVILQNCHPDGAIIETLVARTTTYLEKGFVKPSAKANVQWSFGSNVEGWWFMREVPG